MINPIISSFGIEIHTICKVGCVFLMVVVSILLHAEFGRNDYREDAPHFTMSHSLCGLLFDLLWPDLDLLFLGIRQFLSLLFSINSCNKHYLRCKVITYREWISVCLSIFNGYWYFLFLWFRFELGFEFLVAPFRKPIQSEMAKINKINLG